MEKKSTKKIKKKLIIIHDSIRQLNMVKLETESKIISAKNFLRKDE
jgi:hypothetical protein